MTATIIPFPRPHCAGRFRLRAAPCVTGSDNAGLCDLAGYRPDGVPLRPGDRVAIHRRTGDIAGIIVRLAVVIGGETVYVVLCEDAAMRPVRAGFLSYAGIVRQPAGGVE